MNKLDDFLDAYAVLCDAKDNIFESHRSGEDALIIKKHIVRAFLSLFDIADSRGIEVEYLIETILKKRCAKRLIEFEKTIKSYKEAGDKFEDVFRSFSKRNSTEDHLLIIKNVYGKNE
ncbi:hypothetical protein JCM12296A_56080 [Desulfosarcina cetonica]|uniref:hypothetical protein n=1 Tax=Desulfosarcina cetonica TaxID=90730 RepID=UPI0006D253EE|nr:hypothetical protein [Desulfosarcina cetonica]